MTDYLTEQEQIELLKNWIKQYSLVILLGVLLAAAAIFGWRAFQERQYKLNSHASLLFDDMLTARVQHDTDALSVAMNKLKTHYSRTVYGPFAALMLAKQAVMQKDYLTATQQLNWVIQYSHIASLKQIARLRLARVLLALNQPQHSLEILQRIEDAHFIGFINEVRGDAYLMMHQPQIARAWYQKAIQALPRAEVIRPLLQMKCDALA